MSDWPNPNLYPDYYDPTLAGVRHPILPAGYNSTDIDGDEMNGPGINWPIWTVLFDTFAAGTPLIITDEELSVFSGCADIVIACENNTVVITPDRNNVLIRRAG